MFIRDEEPADIDAIRTVVIEAFENMPHSTLTEPAIIDAAALRGCLGGVARRAR